MRGLCQPSEAYGKVWVLKPVVDTTGRGCVDPPGLKCANFKTYALGLLFDGSLIAEVIFLPP
jgi:hypothetical protein